MKAAALSRPTCILYGLGASYEEALKNANEAQALASEDLDLYPITDAAYATIDRIGGIQITALTSPVCFRRINGTRTIMTTEEAANRAQLT